MSTLSAAIELAPEDASVPAARHIAVELLKAWHAPHDHDDVACG